MSKQLFSFLVGILAGLSAMAQTITVFEQNQPKNYEIKINPKLKAANSNKVIDLLAIAVGKTPDQMLLNCQMVEYLKIMRNDHKISLTAEISNFKIDGDYFYKGFNINNLIIPDVINFTWSLTDAEGKILDKKEIRNKNFKPGLELIKSNRNDTIVNAQYKLIIDNISLDYSRDQLTKLDEFIALIDGYYNADARLSMMENELSVVRVDTLELLQQYRQLTLDNIATINKIKSERYANKLDLDTFDPISLITHIGKAEQKNRDIKKQVEYTLDNMHQAYYFKGMDWLNWNGKQKAKELFKQSLKVKSTYTPPLYQLAIMDFDNHQYTAVLDTCVRINSKLKPDTDTRYNTVRLAEKVLLIYIDSIKLMIDNKDINNSFKLLETSIYYSKRIEGIKTFEEFDQLYAQLYETVYNNLIGQARLLIEAGKLDDAHIFADSAGQLRMNHPQYYINPEKENGVMNQLYKAWVEKGKTWNQAGKNEEALHAFDKATEICRKYPAVQCTNELNTLALKCRNDKYVQLLKAIEPVLAEAFADSAIVLLDQAEQYRQHWELQILPDAEKFKIDAYQIKYDGSIKEGDNAMKTQKAREAIAYYQSASKFASMAQIKADPQWNSKCLAAYKLYIIQLCNQGISYAELMQMGKAGQQQQIAISLADENKLTTDNEVKKALDELAAALDQGECSKAWHDYKIQMGSAERLIGQKEFLKARLALEKATQLAKVNFRCNLTDTASVRKANEISSICKYQMLTDKINPILEQKGFDKAIEYYSAATVFFSDSCPNKYGIVHKPLFEFIFTSQYTGLIESGVKYYTRLGDPQQALKLLDELYRRYFEPAWAKDCQIELGIALAHLDRLRNPEADPKFLVLDYTRNDKWYNHLKKAYLQEWKNR